MWLDDLARDVQEKPLSFFGQSPMDGFSVAERDHGVVAKVQRFEERPMGTQHFVDVPREIL